MIGPSFFHLRSTREKICPTSKKKTVIPEKASITARKMSITATGVQHRRRFAGKRSPPPDAGPFVQPMGARKDFIQNRSREAFKAAVPAFRPPHGKTPGCFSLRPSPVKNPAPGSAESGLRHKRLFATASFCTNPWTSAFGFAG